MRREKRETVAPADWTGMPATRLAWRATLPPVAASG